MSSRRLKGLLVATLAIAAVGGTVAMLNLRDESALDAASGVTAEAPADLISRGAYLARAGNCAACHTSRGGEPYAGGQGIETPFGTVYASNLTPDAATGLGEWSAGHFWRAMHNGRSRDGRLLYPAFPYPNFTRLTRQDSDALYAYLHSQAPVKQANRPHDLRFPFSSQVALAVWRALFFRPAAFEPDTARSAEWNRGSYLVRALGHCDACHGGRNLLGATTGQLELTGGLIPMHNWYAPSLASSHEAGVADWDTEEIVALLKNGVSGRASVMGPMAEVVYRSTQHLSDADLQAMAVFLRELPQRDSEASDTPRDRRLMPMGAKLYEQHCAACHGDQGEGVAGAYPPLAGNRAVTMDTPANLVRVVVNGGYLPATAGNPRPYGMPPFSHQLDNDDIAAVLTFIRGAWGHQAPSVTALDVLRYR